MYISLVCSTHKPEQRGFSQYQIKNKTILNTSYTETILVMVKLEVYQHCFQAQSLAKSSYLLQMLKILHIK